MLDVQTRIKRLEQNGRWLFWLKSFLYLKAYNVVSALFYLHRGITMAQIFWLSIIWSIVALLSEVPSSYLADKWGRKKTILLAVFCALVHWLITLFAHSFALFSLSFVFYSLSFSFLSGTDEALLYDTHKELGEKGSALKKLGRLDAAQRSLKIFGVLIAVLIARNLTGVQFNYLIGLDIFATILAFICALFLTEANHKLDVRKMETGVFTDAKILIKKQPLVWHAMLGKTLFFILAYIPWRFHDAFFIQNLQVPLLVFGAAWALVQVALFFWAININRIWPNLTLNARINRLNFWSTLIWVFLAGLVWFKVNPFIILAIYIIVQFFLAGTDTWYSKIFHVHSASFNRATTISLLNFLKSILDIPLLLLVSFLIQFGYEPILIGVGLLIIPIYYFTQLPRWKNSSLSA